VWRDACLGVLEEFAERSGSLYPEADAYLDGYHIAGGVGSTSERKKAYNSAWKRANRDKVREAKRLEYERLKARMAEDPEVMARQKARQAARNERKREARRGKVAA